MDDKRRDIFMFTEHIGKVQGVRGPQSQLHGRVWGREASTA